MRRTSFALERKGALVRIPAALMLLSAAVRIAWFLLAHGAAADAYTALVHLALPLCSCLLFALCLLQGRLRLSILPMALGCAFFVLKALTFPSLTHTILCCLLYALVFALYALTALGRLPSRFPLFLVFALPFAYHVLVVDLAKLRAPVPPALVSWLPEISVLLIMAALALAALGLKPAAAPSVQEA